LTPTAEPITAISYPLGLAIESPIMSQPPPVVLVDGSSYLFRAYHALPPLTNSKGEATGAIVGVLNMLRKLMAEYQPELMAVVFDAPGKTFRDEMYADYKANRPPAPDDLVAQIEPLHAIVGALGLPMIMVDGVEADDVIGTLAVQADRLGMNTLISTGDKDMAQLVNERISLINTMSDTLLDRQGVIDKFGVAPEQIVDYLSLMGDSVDNIPGVPKCGPKTAAKWLSEFGSLDGVLANSEKIKGKIGENLRAVAPQLPLSRRLTSLKTDVDLGLEVTDLCSREPDRQRLKELYGWLESRRLMASLEQASAPDAASPQSQNASAYHTILTQQALEVWLKRLANADLFAFDTETTSLNYMQAEVVGVSFAIDPGEAAYVPLAHSYPGAPEQLDRNKVLAALQPLLEDPRRLKVGQHLKYDMNVLANYGIALAGVGYDTMLESYVLDSTATRHDMDSLAQKYLGRATIHFEDIAGKGARQLTFNQIPLEQAAPYAAEDADVTLQLHRRLWPQLEQVPSLVKLLEDIEFPLVPVLSRMERNGVRVDERMLADQSKELAERMHMLEQQAYAIAGQGFNMGSPKQIGEIFFNQLQLPVIAKTPKGAPSTAESVLQELADQGHELPRIILEHRGLSKLKSTYTDKLPEMVDPNTGRVHTSYHQAVAATGRLSSSDPNLQNIPIRTELGRRIRRAFVADSGYQILAADYSQIELRIMAHLSGDQALLDAFAQGLDIHRATAAEVFAAGDLDAVSADQRRSAKAINFGLIYGMSAFGLARQLGIERSEAQTYVDLYFDRYPGVRRFMDEIRARAADEGFVETLFGRRLYLPEIHSRNAQRRAAAERTAINAPMQGTAADIIKQAMLAVDAWIQGEQPAVKMIMQVHDELVFEVREEVVAQHAARIRGFMETAAELRVPLLVDVGTGANWEMAH
jgi:DNA polymerase-1